MTVETALAELESTLPGLNYVVSFDLHRVPLIANGKPLDYIQAAIGPKAVLGDASETTSHDMAAEIERCIKWKGDRGSHPDEDVIQSPRLDDLVNVVVTHFWNVAEHSTQIWSFWLRDGHPHYPVQWDFAFILVGSENADIFIGSSSD